MIYLDVISLLLCVQFEPWLESAWSAWMETYQFLAYQTDELWSQRSFVPFSIKQNPGIFLEQGQLKCYPCQVCGLLKHWYYYEYRTLISVWLSFGCPTFLIYICHSSCCQKRSWHVFCWNLLGRFLVLIQLLVIPKQLCGNVFHHQSRQPQLLWLEMTLL